MTKSILLFPGQGSQYVGMSAPYQKSSQTKSILDTSKEILGFDIEALMNQGPLETLNQTENTQPALFITSMLGFEILKDQVTSYHAVAGHSLGEYSALCAAGVLSFEETLKLVKLRGSLMGVAGEKSPGSMSAILGLDTQIIEKVLLTLDPGNQLVVANYNSPGQTVISGDTALIEKSEPLLLEAGAKKVVRLPVSGAFHSPLMNFAVAGLTQAIENLEFKVPLVPLIQNTTGKFQSDPTEIKKALIAQITSPVQWVKSIEAAVAQDYTQAIEVGPGKVLMGLGRAISRELKITPIESMDLALE